jgi:hypothetical protein
MSESSAILNSSDSEKDKIKKQLIDVEKEIDDMKDKKISGLKLRHVMFKRLDLVMGLQRLEIMEAAQKKFRF